jgi:hypothetical protein
MNQQPLNRDAIRALQPGDLIKTVSQKNGTIRFGVVTDNSEHSLQINNEISESGSHSSYTMNHAHFDESGVHTDLWVTRVIYRDTTGTERSYSYPKKPPTHTPI